MHYHKVDVFARQREIAGEAVPSLDRLLDIPVATGTAVVFDNTSTFHRMTSLTFGGASDGAGGDSVDPRLLASPGALFVVLPVASSLRRTSADTLHL